MFAVLWDEENKEVSGEGWVFVVISRVVAKVSGLLADFQRILK